MVGAVGKFWILVFLESLKRNLMISKKALLLCQNVGAWPLCHPTPPPPPPPTLPLYAEPVYVFTVFLFYLYSCANIIAKLISKAKAMAIIQN